MNFGWVLYIAVTTLLASITLWVLLGMKTVGKWRWWGVAVGGLIVISISLFGLASFGFYLMPLGIILIAFSLVKMFTGR